MKHMRLYPLLATLALFASRASFAEAPLHAHEHGSVKVGIAVEKNVAMINLDTPAESIIGFEYQPKTAQEKDAYNKAEAQWKNIFDLFAFDHRLGCHAQESSFVQKFDEPDNTKDQKPKKAEGIHSDIEASVKVLCRANIEGSAVKVGLKKYFKNIKKLTVDVVAGKTFSVEVKNPLETIQL